MSEPRHCAPDEGPSVAAVAAPVDLAAGTTPTAGALLHTARRAAGLSIEQLSDRVKVPVHRLIALEQDRFEGWPDANVVRATAASVCRHVRLDPEIVLARLPKMEKPVFSGSGAHPAVRFRDSGGFQLRNPQGLGRWSLAMLVLVIGVAAFALYVFLRAPMWSAPSVAAPLRAPESVVPADPVLPPDAGPTDTRLAAQLPGSDASAGLEKAQSPEPGRNGSKEDGRGPGSTTAATAVEPPAQPLLLFKVNGLTWIDVTDAKGTVLLRKTMSTGEAAVASGALPLFVVVGRADHTSVEVRGQALKLETTSADNVARFKVQ